MDLVKYLELKQKLREQLEDKLSKDSLEKAAKDHHSRRPPRPCGMTVHTGIGCSLCCTYCYIYDMGFPRTVTPYPLSKYEMLYALALNPYFMPGHGGTMMAMGAVSEPFLPETRDRSIEYIEAFGLIKNPVQISTKVPVGEDYVERICRSCPHISILVTIIALRNYRKLEPLAPDPQERLNFCKILVKHNLHVSIFMRPIIPGITDVEAEEILNQAYANNVKNVVLGTLRITKRIFKNLLKLGIDLSSRVVKISDREQYPIKSQDIKYRIEKIATKIGFKVHKSACSANIEASGLGCIACEWGPCGDINKIPDVSESDILEFCKRMNYKVSNIIIDDKDGSIILRDVKGRNINILKHVLRELTRRKIIIR